MLVSHICSLGVLRSLCSVGNHRGLMWFFLPTEGNSTIAGITD
ncbi:hypothetical protein [Vibrio marinisediminis]|nr:hypothetical protein [Vibrio marinisediminis]